MISKIDDVVNALRADATLTGLLGGQYIYWLIPNVTPAPAKYITLQEVSNSESESADDEEYADDIEIQGNVFIKEGSTIPVAKQLQKTMRRLGFTHDAQEDQYYSDTKVYHKPIRFFIQETI